MKESNMKKDNSVINSILDLIKLLNENDMKNIKEDNSIIFQSSDSDFEKSLEMIGSTLSSILNGEKLSEQYSNVSTKCKSELVDIYCTGLGTASCNDVVEKVEFFDFGFGKVPAHRHRNPNGELGGWVDSRSVVDKDSVIDEFAQVVGASYIEGCSLSQTAKVIDSKLVAVNVRDIAVISQCVIVSDRKDNISFCGNTVVKNGYIY